MSDRPTDAELWAAVEATVRDQLLDALTDPWARATAVRLVGLARYARTRASDPTAARTAEVAALLSAHAGEPVVAAHWPAEDPLRAAGQVLAACVALDPPPAVQAPLRGLLITHLDTDLAESAPLLGAFRGKLPRA